MSEAIGVLGPNTGRSVGDRNLESTFNPLWKGGHGQHGHPGHPKLSQFRMMHPTEPFTGASENFSMPNRSSRDEAENKALNPEFAHFKEDYCGCRGPTPAKHTLLQDDPYFPTSYYNSYVNIS